MNDDETKLERQLREATGAPGSTSAGCAESLPAGCAEPLTAGCADPLTAGCASSTAGRDAETAALAEGWLALGQLLDAANADFRPELVVKQLRRRLLRRRLWRGGALLAATLLIGVSVAWFVDRNQLSDSINTPRNGSDVAAEHPAANPNAKANDAAVEPSVVVENSAGNSGWDQALDQQIAQVDEGVLNAGTLANRGDDSIDRLGQQLTSFRQEVEKDSL
ncbi:MAG TPA: hypothetical protein VGY55_14225 [Pirellulales bacterium]|jgi:hypothetical protein|nr:hypothetical protein [Pirellulales bacterium]